MTGEGGSEQASGAAVPPGLVWLAGIAWRALVIGIALVALGVVFARLSLILLPLIVALVLATFLEPPTAWLKRHRVRPALAAFIVLTAFLLLLTGIGYLLVPEVVDELGELGTAVQDGLRQVERWLREGPLALSGEDIESYTDQFVDYVRENQGTITSGVLTGAVLAFEIVAGSLLALVILFFYMKDGDRISSWALSLVDERNHDDIRAIARRAWRSLSGYLRGAAIEGLIEAVVVAVALTILGIPLALPLGALTFFAGFLPVVGAILAGTVASLVALVSGGLADAILVALLFTAVQQLQGNLLDPIIMGRAVRLHPLAVLVAVTTGAILWGILGAFLAVPFTAVVYSALDEARRRGVTARLGGDDQG